MTKKELKRFKKGMEGFVGVKDDNELERFVEHARKKGCSTIVKMEYDKITLVMTHEDYEALEVNLKRLDTYKDTDEGKMAHEAGHMLVARKEFPSNIYSYGIDEKTGKWCVIDRNIPIFDLEKVIDADIQNMTDGKIYTAHPLAFAMKTMKIAVAGYVALCKAFGLSFEETNVLVGWLWAEKFDYEEGSDFKRADDMEDIAKCAIKVDRQQVVKQVYDMLDTDEIKREIELQTEMKKTA